MKEQTSGMWKIDAGHSSIRFRVSHMAVANVSGTFNRFSGTVSDHGKDDFDGAEVSFGIQTHSLNTNNQQRDEHLLSGLFFDADQFPDLKFTGFLKKTADAYALTGDLTIRDVTKAVKLDTELTGRGKGRFGDTLAGFEITGEINRKDFGLTWDMMTEAGGFIVGQNIKLYMDIELISL
jgi:polyisoprenoid-binding protein YceI